MLGGKPGLGTVGGRDRCPGESQELLHSGNGTVPPCFVDCFWLGFWVSCVSGKCTLIYAWSQPHSLSNEEMEAGSRTESWGDCPL